MVPHSQTLSAFFGEGKFYAAYIVGTPYLSNIVAVYASKHLVKKRGWLVATCVNTGFITLGSLCCFCCVAFEPLRHIWLLLAAELVFGLGMGCQFIGRQLGVETSSASARNKIFSQQTTATSFGILCGTSTSGVTTLLQGTSQVAWVVGLPFAILCCLGLTVMVVALIFLPNNIVKVPDHEATAQVAKVPTTGSQMSIMDESDRKLRIWSTIAVGFNRVVVRSMVENETTAFYQILYGYPEVVSSTCLAMAYIVGIVTLQVFGVLHDRLTDRVWIYITLALIFTGTAIQFPLFPDNKMFETVKFTAGICMVLPGLAVNTAVANSTASKYAIKTHWLYNNEMIGLLQILTQTTLARIVGPFAGYVLASQSMRFALAVQFLVTFVSLVLVYRGVSSNSAETAKGRASLRLSQSQKLAIPGNAVDSTAIGA